MAKLRTASGLTGVSFLFRDATGLRTIAAPKIRTVAGLVNLYGVGGGGGGASTFTAAAQPDAAYGASNRPGLVTSNRVTVTPTGGVGPYTYAWSTDPSMSVTTPTAASTTFRGGLSSGDTLTATYTCTVTDSAGRTAASNPVSVTLENYGSQPL